MTRIHMPFNEWSLERLLNGKKIATSRNKKYGKLGDVFIIRKKIFRITGVERLKLTIVAKFHYKEEGAETPVSDEPEAPAAESDDTAEEE